MKVKIAILVSFFCCCIHATAQYLTFRTQDYEVNAPLDKSDIVVQANFNALNNAEGPVKVFRLKDNDTVFLFKGQAKNNLLYDTAYWYSENGNLKQRTFFKYPYTQTDATKKINVYEAGLEFWGIPHGEEKQWWYGSDVFTELWLVEKRQYLNGQQQGWQYTFSPDGQLRSRTMYVDDMKEGLSQEFTKGEQVRTGGNYLHNKKNGTWNHYDRNGCLNTREFYGKNGLDSTLDYFENGAIKKRVVKIDKDNSDCFIYHETGYLLKYFRAPGKNNSWTEVTFHPNGKPADTLYMKDGWASGEYRSWYPNGALYQKVLLEKNKRHGFYTSYYPDGQLKAKGMYNAGKKEGIWEHYRMNGKPTDMKPEMRQEEERWYYYPEPILKMEEEELTEIIRPYITGSHYDPFPKMKPQDIRSNKKLRFTKKSGDINITVNIDVAGKASYTINTKLKPSQQKALTDYLENQLQWKPMDLHGHHVACKTDVIIIWQRKLSQVPHC